MSSGTIKNLSPHHNYSTIPTHVLTSDKLSAAAKGLLAFLLSLPKNHNIDKKDLPKYFKEGYYALNTAFEELIKRRFIHKIELRDRLGHFKGFEYQVHEFPKKRVGDMKKVLPSRNNRKSGHHNLEVDLINKYFNEDCLVTMSRMPDNFVDLVLTSPCYDDMRHYHGNNKFEFEKIAVELTRVLKDGGVIVWIVGDETRKGSESGSAFRQVLYFKDRCGLNLHDSMVWEKSSTTYPAKVGGNRYSQVAEWMFILTKGKPKTSNLLCDKENRWVGTTNFGQKTDRDKNDNLVLRKKFKPIPQYSPRTNIWKYVTSNSTDDKIAHLHPAIFPEQLVADHILTWTNEFSDIVFDCFCGSGTTLKMAKQLNRKFIGSEIVMEYCKIIEKRLSL